MGKTSTDEAIRAKGSHFLSFWHVFFGNGKKRPSLKIPEFPVIFTFCVAGLRTDSFRLLSLPVSPKLGKFVTEDGAWILATGPLLVSLEKITHFAWFLG